MKVWSWHQRDPQTAEDMSLVVAVEAWREVNALTARNGLRKPERPRRLRSVDDGFSVALASPGHILWREAYDEVFRPGWKDEAALAEFRVWHPRRWDGAPANPGPRKARP